MRVLVKSTTKVRKYGRSLYILLPSEVRQHFKVKGGEVLDIYVVENSSGGKLIVLKKPESVLKLV